MPGTKSIIGLTLLLCAIFNTAASLAAAPVKIIKTEGTLTLNTSSGSSKTALKAEDTVSANSILATGTDGRAVVRVGKTGYLVLERNSQVEISTSNDHAGFFRHITGMIYYAVNHLQNKDQNLEVKLKTATMAIRGTRFLVSEQGSNIEVGMRKGLLSLSARDADFEIHRMTEQDEFEASKREAAIAIAAEKERFEQYKNDTSEQFVEYKKNFALGAGQMVSIDGNRVEQRPLSGAAKKEMETLEEYAAQSLSEVRD